jgi:hypothetical protein
LLKSVVETSGEVMKSFESVRTARVILLQGQPQLHDIVCHVIVAKDISLNESYEAHREYQGEEQKE